MSFAAMLGVCMPLAEFFGAKSMWALLPFMLQTDTGVKVDTSGVMQVALTSVITATFLAAMSWSQVVTTIEKADATAKQMAQLKLDRATELEAHKAFMLRTEKSISDLTRMTQELLTASNEIQRRLYAAEQDVAVMKAQSSR